MGISCPLSPRGLAIDGGTSVGAYRRIMARHFDRLLAFEQAPDTHACLARNLADRGWAGRVEARAGTIRYTGSMADNDRVSPL